MMAKFVLIFGLMVLSSAALKDLMLKENKTPKESSVLRATTFMNTCDECQALIIRFAETIKNPEKMEELKDLLRMLCHQTLHEYECRVFVNELEHFLQKFEKYLKDPKKICEHLRLCSNRKIDQFRRIDMIYGKKKNENVESDLICDECQLAADELKHSIEDEKVQLRLKKFISEEICVRLGELRGKCDLLLEEFLPEVIEELDKLLKNTKAFCADIGLCKRSIDQYEDTENDAINPKDVSIFANFNF
ncbi:unnamed protein product [Thelazia callipaeda]|uniref:Saposin B-type domain-containing protein n=1 Tax=Thelazia callipaeda TaxID=103827 RepID=A0A0N5CLL2_THECL|nr:unnamed protein product [Thelazia callipaeda]